MAVARRSTLYILSLTGALALMAARPTAAHAQDKQIQLGSSSDQSLSDLTGEDQYPLQITGFGVADYAYDQRSGDNTAEAGKLAVSFFREISDRFWFFGQLTTALSADNAAGGEVPTETEIDNLLVNYTPGGASGMSFSFGKFDVPVGFERDDEPLNFQATPSYNFELARPSKMVGLVGRWAMAPTLDFTAMVGNGWDSQIDPNKRKTVGLRVGFIPTEQSSFGLSAMTGGEGQPGSVHQRYLLSFDYAVEPTDDWIVAGEANVGGQQDALPGGGTASWSGAMLTLFRRVSEHVGATLRGETFHDPDGVRSGDAQTLSSLTFSPVYFVGTGREGIFANVEHTTFRIPRFQIRAEARLDHSSEPLFGTAAQPSHWGMRYTFQLVTTF